MTTIELVWDSKCLVGESPVWDARNRRILFIDIHGGRLRSYAPDTRACRIWEIGDKIGSFGLCRSGRLVMALANSIILFDTATGRRETLVGDVGEPAHNRLNDGKVGPDGCFWVGGLDDRPLEQKQPTGSFYRITPDGRVERKIEGGFITGNGLAWTPDRRTMFYCCSKQAFIDAWDFDPATGGISGRRRLATMTDEAGRPDGGACDAEGNYWSAGVSAGRFNVFSPAGKKLRSIPTPATPRPTMPCFAERWLYMTSMRRGRDAETLRRFPESGGLHRMPSPVAGAEIGRFADS